MAAAACAFCSWRCALITWHGPVRYFWREAPAQGVCPLPHFMIPSGNSAYLKAPSWPASFQTTIGALQGGGAPDKARVRYPGTVAKAKIQTREDAVYPERNHLRDVVALGEEAHAQNDADSSAHAMASEMNPAVLL